jgi:SAM-dependent methyltransferase
VTRSASGLRFSTLFVTIALAAGPAAQPARSSRPAAWPDLPAAIQARLQSAGVSSDSFPALLERLNRTHAQRVREGDLDHLVFYLLQSTHFTREPAIEPAVSAKAFVESMPAADRARYLREGKLDVARVPTAVLARTRDFSRALDARDRDPRLVFFRQLAEAALPSGRAREDAIVAEYARTMRFLYQKEFVARHAPDPADAVASLYRSRGLSTDTAIEAGYLVSIGIGVMRSLSPDRRVRRVLVVGPGLDLAPRTGFSDTAPPESYQPWAVADALLALGASKRGELTVVAADVNARVVAHLRREPSRVPALRKGHGIEETRGLRFVPEYREYLASIGKALDSAGGLSVRAEALNIVTERLEGEPFDLVIATNILPYFDDTELALALSNIAGMLSPGGILLHNDLRRSLPAIAAAAGLPVEQARQAPIAQVTGAPPLADTVFLHQRR